MRAVRTHSYRPVRHINNLRTKSNSSFEQAEWCLLSAAKSADYRSDTSRVPHLWTMTWTQRVTASLAAVAACLTAFYAVADAGEHTVVSTQLLLDLLLTTLMRRCTHSDFTYRSVHSAHLLHSAYIESPGGCAAELSCLLVPLS